MNLRSRVFLVVVVLAAIYIPFQFWVDTSFRTSLDDDSLRGYLTRPEKPRHIQHALVQLTQRIQEDRGTAEPFYEDALRLVEHKESAIRSMLAWVLGFDNTHQPFQDGLQKLLQDEHPNVRYNAALSLVKFGDTSIRPVLLEMLRPFRVGSGVDGKVREIFASNRPVRSGVQLALVVAADGKESGVPSPLDGRIRRVFCRSGDKVNRGDDLVEILPGEMQVWEALKALYLIGRPEDLPEVRRWTVPVPPYSKKIQIQAQQTALHLENRSKSSGTSEKTENPSTDQNP
ncbi:MAG: HEAT repeat domain-containing protein [Planctomycetota bacterium]|nr:HEAT repeat domain-containing protein [Planctomycetota bacterium]